MKNYDGQDGAFSDYGRLVHGIESNKKYLMEMTGKVKGPRENWRGLEMIIQAQEGLLSKLGGIARGHDLSRGAMVPTQDMK